MKTVTSLPHLLSFKCRLLMLEMEDFPKQLLIHYRAHWTAQLCFTWSTEVQIYKTSGNNAVPGPRAIQTMN